MTVHYCGQHNIVYENNRESGQRFSEELIHDDCTEVVRGVHLILTPAHLNPHLGDISLMPSLDEENGDEETLRLRLRAFRWMFQKGWLGHVGTDTTTKERNFHNIVPRDEDCYGRLPTTFEKGYPWALTRIGGLLHDVDLAQALHFSENENTSYIKWRQSYGNFWAQKQKLQRDFGQVSKSTFEQ